MKAASGGLRTECREVIDGWQRIDYFRRTVSEPDRHSVAELVWHCIYWRRVTLDRLQGGENKYRNEQNKIVIWC